MKKPSAAPKAPQIDGPPPHFWYAMYRAEGYDPKDMVVAWLTYSKLEEEIDRYRQWDIRATGSKMWRVEKFPRKTRSTYFREECRYGDDLIEYHYVLDDRDIAQSTGQVETLKTIDESEIAPS